MKKFIVMAFLAAFAIGTQAHGLTFSSGKVTVKTTAKDSTGKKKKADTAMNKDSDKKM